MITTGLTTGGLVFTLWRAGKTGVWNHVNREAALTTGFNQALNNLRTEMVAAIDKSRAESTHNLAAINREMNEGFENFTNKFSDTVQALREHVHKMELYSEREFLTKKEFYEHARTGSDAVKALEAQVNARLDRSDAVIDMIREKQATS